MRIIYSLAVLTSCVALWGATVLRESGLNPQSHDKFLTQLDADANRPQARPGRAPAVDPQTRAALHHLVGDQSELAPVMEAVAQLRARKPLEATQWVALKRLDRRVMGESGEKKGLDPMERSPSSSN